jgi:AraC-like DNA-binding protein
MGRARKADDGRQHGPLAQGPTVWARDAARVLAFSQAQGARRELLLAHSGLEAVALEDPDARIPLVSLYALVEAGARECADAQLGLHLALRLEAEDLGALGFLMVNSPTLGMALEHLLRYQRVWNEGERYTVRPEGSRVALGYTPYGPERPAHHLMAQMAMADLLVNGGQLVGAWPEARVRFRAPRPSQVAEYTRVLGVEPEFGAPVDELLLPGEVLARPLPGADAALRRFFERYLEDRLRQLPESPPRLSERLRGLLVELLPEGKGDLAHVAGRLRMSPRTLQRRLREEGTSLQAELESLRRQEALLLLERGVAIAEVAWMLGYSEPSAFHHAFKKWTGTSPEAWRSRPPGG